MKHRSLLLLVIVLLYSVVSAAQVPTGTPPFGSFGGGPDIVNLANLNVHIAVPVLNKAGRGMPFTYVLSYDSSAWYPVGSSNSQSWQPVSNWGWRGQTEVATGYVSFNTQVFYCYTGRIPTGQKTTYSGYVYHDAFGASHPFSGTTIIETGTCGSLNTSLTATANDGSGYTLSATGSSIVNSVTSAAGKILNPPVGSSTGAGTATDSNGNQISVSSSGVFTDTLGTTALAVSGSAPNPVTFTYTSPSGANASFTMKYWTYTVQTAFGCSGTSEYGPTSVSLVSEIDRPDGTKYTFAYEPTPGNPSNVTGRLASVTLPTGSTIFYSYTGSNNGMTCSDGSAAGLTRTTPDGTWTYTRSGTSPAWTTTVTDPQQNQTVLNFQSIYETQRQLYQGSTSGTLLRTVTTCYKGNTTNCTSTAVNLPIAQRTVFVQLPGGLQSETNTLYNTYGLVTEKDEYGYGTGAPGSLVRKTLTSYASLGNGIVNRPASITVQDSAGNTKAQTTYSYDQSTVTGTSGTPQHGAVSGSRGNATTITYLVQGTTTLSRTFTYYDTGNVYQATDVNGAVTTNTYGTGSCGNSFVTSISLPLNLSRSQTWSCTGGVLTAVTDENGNTTSYTYNDPYFWRVNSITDPASNVTNYTYTGATVTESSLVFNGTSSTVDVLKTLDGLGRIHVTQRKQAPSSGNYDSVETDYDTWGRPSRVTLPYSGTAGQTNPSAPATTTVYDALARPTQVNDAGGGSIAFSYTQNDVYRTVGPAPTGENTKRRQFEYDALGRLTSVCELASVTGSGTCAQTAAQTGYWTKYTYDILGNLIGVTQNAQSTATQARSYSYDGLGRMTSETEAESGTTTYVYDSDATCGNSAGDLVKRVDAVGNTACYSYDALHRRTSITYPSGTYAASTPAKTFVYDSATVNGVSMANTKNRLAEAYTGPSTAKITDLGLSYSVRGEVTDVYESTPHSGGYYHVNATYWANGALNQLSGLSGLPTLTYGVDGEGRAYSASASTGQNPVASTMYNTASQPTQVNFGSLDSDAFTFDSNTGRMTQYKFNVNGQSLVGNPGWNANGTLATLGIADPFNAANAQNCSYGYDDLARLGSANCGTVWAQTFGYDAFGNLTKSGSISFQPTYSATTNRMASLPGFTPSYDANGNVLNDSFHSYSWDAQGRPVSIDSVGLTHDAQGRMVEQNNGGAYTEIVYSPAGSKLALMNGQTLQKAFVPLPAGAVAVYTSSGLSYYRHPDWLGSSRFASTSSRAMYFDVAYAPFGESYAPAGTSDLSFTGQNQDTAGGLYDFMYREYSTQGRWPSPDPAGLKAMSLANPQTFNRYAYVANNPVNSIDLFGLVRVPGFWGGGGGGINLNALLYMFAYSGVDFLGSCTADGLDTPCSVVQGLLSSGGAVQCPNNQCTRVGNNGVQYFWASTNGPGAYYSYSGPGALFFSPEAAAAGAFEYIFGTFGDAGTGDVRREYGGDITVDANGVYSYTDPIPGDNTCTIDTVCSFDPDKVVDPPGTTRVGIYHSHPFGGGYTYPNDYDWSEALGVPSYLGNPQGCVQSYTPVPNKPYQGSVSTLQGTSSVCP